MPRTIARHPLLVLLIAFALTALALTQAVKLRVDANIITLLPPEYTSVQALQKLQDEVGSETTVDVAIYSPAFDDNIAFANAFIPRMMALERSPGEPQFTRFEFKRDIDFVSRNALYFATFDELDRLEAFLRGQAQQVRVANDPLRMNLFRPSADSLEQKREEDEDQLKSDLAQIALQEYQISDDSTTLVVKFVPTGMQTNIGYVEGLYASIDSLVIAMQPGRFNPEMVVTPAGRLLRQTIEVRSITRDVSRSFGSGVLSVLFAVVLYFLYKSIQARTGGRLVLRVVLSELLRTPVTAILLAVPLLMSLSWAGGVAGVAFGTLNLMTSTLGLVLFGLGIDYGIHFYARYAEERGAGMAVDAAIEETFVSTGQGIAVSALTTSSALFVLQLADFRGFSEFGLIGGLGILFALISMLTVLPALISIAERIGALNLRQREIIVARERETRFPFARTILGISIALIAVALYVTPRVAFEYNFKNLEPEYDEYFARAKALEPVSNQSERSNPAYILIDDPSDVPDVVAALKTLAKSDSSILAIESLQERFPRDSVSAQAKLDRLASIRDVLNDPFLAADTTGQVARLRQAASVTEPIALDSVPAFLTRPFMTKKGEVGNFVIVFPQGIMNDGRRSMRFAAIIGQVTTPSGENFYAASTQLVAADMLRLMQEESPPMVELTFGLVIILVFISFRSLLWTMIALAPLTVGLIWMLGLMVIGSVELTFYNLVVLPTVLGIGNDGGVHLTHRYQDEGKGGIRQVLRSTGEHVTMGALTNLIGFGGLLLSTHPGLRSIGVLAVVGIGATLAATLIFFPALIQVLEDRGTFDKKPKRRRKYDLGDWSTLRRPTFQLRLKDASEVKRNNDSKDSE